MAFCSQSGKGKAGDLAYIQTYPELESEVADDPEVCLKLQ